MGLYGSPDTGNLYSEKKKEKKEGYKPQKNIWFWVVVVIVDIIMFLASGKGIDDILTLVILDSIIVFGISFVSLIANLVKKRKIGNDIKFIGISVLVFFIFIIILGTL